MSDPKFWFDIVVVLAGVLSAGLYVKFRVEQLEKDVAKNHAGELAEKTEWRRLCMSELGRAVADCRNAREEDHRERDERRRLFFDEYAKFQVDVWREVGTVRTFKHEYPNKVMEWQLTHEREAAGQRIKFTEQLGAVAVSIATHGETFNQIKAALDKVNERLDKILERG